MARFYPSKQMVVMAQGTTSELSSDKNNGTPRYYKSMSHDYHEIELLFLLLDKVLNTCL